MSFEGKTTPSTKFNSTNEEKTFQFIQLSEYNDILRIITSVFGDRIRIQPQKIKVAERKLF